MTGTGTGTGTAFVGTGSALPDVDCTALSSCLDVCLLRSIFLATSPVAPSMPMFRSLLFICATAAAVSLRLESIVSDIEEDEEGGREGAVIESMVRTDASRSSTPLRTGISLTLSFSLPFSNSFSLLLSFVVCLGGGGRSSSILSITSLLNLSSALSPFDT